MALLGISLIVASVVLLVLRRPEWLQQFWTSLYRQASQNQLPRPPQRPVPRIEEPKPEDVDQVHEKEKERIAVPKDVASPPLPPPVVILENGINDSPGSPREGQTTPKASAVIPSDSVPAFTLSVPELAQQQHQPQVEEKPTPAVTSSTSSTSMMMPPPPLPAAARGSLPANLLRQPGTSTLPLPPSSGGRPGGGPLPNRGPPSSSSGGGGSSLFPPPTHSTKPAKPSRAVVLTPGHSPLDWARLSGHPTADLRGLPKDTPYLRVTPSLLRKMTGRKGKDAWMVLGGRVYNITPYIPFHPGGEPELLKGAGRDGTKLFGEIHPWVNYEGMLAACLVGIYVSEEDGEAAAAAAKNGGVNGAGGGGSMEEMD
ncbi:hypothetical protein NCU06051 [Neurospora crassa OR74A]|uniref:Cytochrome b5 heme-binding domain-containing protein n=1 Tax=Neurospora crassa (strain ATCC 24698 / 74-OR23-1A / CBS 708.71 / DSM 1257 / FGSC 987) TaxID=367110 RepID=Q7S4Z9_NEUCR|nr:hypothetical protein NCU06051 [Neurospora crassa OR74A]EAA30578.1 hypothetical protein NCU06051 [Neurospora crassa OR74A]|eukprot:XP_959814.1 hypothetical protein NCU06051 [Neurospora crassa OR74A]